MGFLSPKMPPFDMHFWFWGKRAERLKPMCQHWGEHGFAGPWGIWVLYGLKMALFVAGWLGFALATPGIGPLEAIGSWWTEPVVFQKAVIWSLLFEVVGLGGGFGPLTVRFWPPMGGFLYWLRPGTVRLPPWPSRVPLTRGTRRTGLDVLLYLGVLVAAGWLLLSPASRVDVGFGGQLRMLEPDRLVPLVVLLPLLGLRDKTIFLAARAEHYWVVTLTFFLPFVSMIVTAKLLMVLLWWAAATAKLSRIFPFTVSAMLSNGPLTPKWLRRRLFRAFPEDMRPSRGVSGSIAWLVVAVEYGCPLALLVSTARSVTLAALVLLAVFHLVIVLSAPIGVPLEWNLFIAYEAVFLFWGHFPVTLSTTADPVLPTLVAIPVVALVTWGNLRPDQVSYQMSMRYYAGNWPTSMWALRRSAIAKIHNHVTISAGFPKEQLRRLYGEQVAEVVAHRVYTFRSLHHHGRALFGLLPRAGGPDHEDAVVMEGELVAGTVLGWNFGDGHLHNEQLMAALQERCRFEPGEVRAVILESAPLGADRQEYRLVDAAAGEFERGHVLVGDMADRQPWEIDDLPVHVVSQVRPVPGDRVVEPAELDEPVTLPPQLPGLIVREPDRRHAKRRRSPRRAGTA